MAGFNRLGCNIKLGDDLIILNDDLNIPVDAEVYDGDDFFDTDHTTGGVGFLENRLKDLPKRPKSKRKRIRKKYFNRLVRWHNDSIQVFLKRIK